MISSFDKRMVAGLHLIGHRDSTEINKNRLAIDRSKWSYDELIQPSGDWPNEIVQNEIVWNDEVKLAVVLT